VQIKTIIPKTGHWTDSSHHTARYTVMSLLYRVLETEGIKFMAVTLPDLNRFSKFLASRLIIQFSIDCLLQIPPHLKHVGTLPYEISVFSSSLI